MKVNASQNEKSHDGNIQAITPINKDITGHAGNSPNGDYQAVESHSDKNHDGSYQAVTATTKDHESHRDYYSNGAQ